MTIMNFELLCVSAFFVQTIYAQCLCNAGVQNKETDWTKKIGASGSCGGSSGWANGLVGSGFSAASVRSMLPGIYAADGGAYSTYSLSPLAPHGITAFADNLQMEGALDVAGNMPFLTSVTLNGPLASSGQATVAFGSGDENVGITSESCGMRAGVEQSGSGFGISGLGHGTGNGIPAERAYGTAARSTAGMGYGTKWIANRDDGKGTRQSTTSCGCL